MSSFAGTPARLFGLLVLVLALPVSIAEEDAPKRSAKDGLAATIRLGEEIVERTSTHPLTKEFVGNALNCTSCHLENGRHPRAASFIGVATAYPAWSPREQRVITLEDRILNCFMRSQNGTRPPLGSRPSVAISAYITSLSAGQSIKQNPNKPLGPNHVPPLNLKGRQADTERGARLYAQQCADCHAVNGAGTDDGPPVWGAASYNAGAGLSRNDKLASWLKVAMPLGDENLSDEDAFDIAAFVNSHERRAFTLSDHLPPADRLGEYNGTRPKSP